MLKFKMLKKIKKITLSKIKLRLWGNIVKIARLTRFYPFIYRSYWHSIFCKSECMNDKKETCYFAARPNPGAGIGHQLANWIAGFYGAKLFKMKFAHIPFSSDDWESFFEFGKNEESFISLKQRGFKIRKIPLFSFGKLSDVDLIRKIITSYCGQKIVFLCEQDQFLRDLQLIIPDIQRKFFNASIRKRERLDYNRDHFNIAIHVRRGDIMANSKNPNLTMRILNNDYFKTVLTNTLGMFKNKIDKPIHIYFFSQGIPSDYPEFERFENLHWCMDWNAKKSFLHMVYADVLITSKSSFSYKPALLNKGVKVCPKDFWHGYPEATDWIMCDRNGNFIYS